MGFGRACAARTRIFGLIPTPNGALRAPPPITASLLFSLYSKNKIFYLTRAARVKGFFLSTLPPRPESIQSARPFIQSSELGPPPPQLQESVAPPFGSRGETHSLPDEVVRGTNSDDGAYTLVLQVYYNYNTSTTEAMKYNVP